MRGNLALDFTETVSLGGETVAIISLGDMLYNSISYDSYDGAVVRDSFFCGFNKNRQFQTHQQILRQI